MSNWTERAEQEIEEAYANGDLSDEEYRKAYRELRWEIQDSACQAAEEAYHRAMEGW